MFSRKNFVALAAAGALMTFAFPAFSYPVVPGQTQQATGNSVEYVGWRCGRGWHMNRWGRCVPNRARLRGVCGRGWHLNRFGRCVPNRQFVRPCPRGMHLTPRGFCVANRW